ncbi:ribonuclease E/G [Caulobacter sp. S45]|uniref:Rne/Rng family ribonuclease n=1 Tax=Caulobacter sp. S45 TaxID=1641861 RepID=UPI00131BA9F7|nr:ribonuclease E/G [Caulobacter sp. S45]
MTKRMLIDAAHAEETRVAVVDGSRIEELDFESQSRKQLRGNIYLAKITRVEPSLQAAFIEYGGNRHGFLAFNEIHPDYYQIPIADREALLREVDSDHHDDDDGDDAEDDDSDDEGDRAFQRRQRRLMRRYKIQEVIRRRQIMLVQVVKEERGNKGAALTTYLSLAGRYGVLMPNTGRGGGISRKITSATDRKRLKSVVQSLDVPTGMGLIVRTAGAKRTKAEIQRDYEYLLRLWENIRENTLKSVAPALIYEEEDLVKRAIRDMYDKDLDGILVEGEAGYREARDFMRMIMPSQANKIKPYREATPLFVAHKIEDQLAQIHSPVVPLRSGGYLVINQTEALVAIDVNSGKATRERNIEATAFKTNMEAAEEAARQLRLRDLAGLIVIDFIDMDEAKNNRMVEKVLKDALSLDRARVQMGKISGFGLMEISRQRRRSGVLEGTTHVCEHCQGTGRVRSVESSALAALRSIEVEAAKAGAGMVNVRLPAAVALYVLNEKRAYIARLEQMHDLEVTILIDEALSASEVGIERIAAFEPAEGEEGAAPRRSNRTPILLPPEPAYEEDPVFEVEEEDFEDEEVEDEAETETEGEEASEDRSEGRGDKSRRRRRRRGGSRETEADAVEDAPRADEDDEEGFEGASEEEKSEQRRRRRRGRRGGRRMREEGGAPRDPYAWVHAHGGRDRPHPNDDPYAWRDPHAPHARPEDRVIEARAEKVIEAKPQPAAVQPATGEADPYVWTEAGAEVEGEGRTPRSRTRNRRGRGRGRDRVRGEETPMEDTAAAADQPEAPTEIPADPQGAPEVEIPAPTETPAESPIQTPAEPEAPPPETPDAPIPDSPTPETPAPVETPHDLAAPVEAAPVAEPEAQPAPEPAPEPEPDPNEITGLAPAAPKRGWWRRNA